MSRHRNIAAEILGERPIAYYPSLAKRLGSVKASVLLGQLLYWTPRADDPAGWIHKSREEIFEEIGLSRSEQETARKVLRTTGLVDEKRQGVPPRLHFRVNQELLEGLFQTAGNQPFERQAPNGGKPADQTAGNQPVNGQDPGPTDGAEPAEQTAGNPPISVTETTTETTQREKDPSADAPPGRRRDVVWETLEELYGPAPVTSRFRGGWNAAAQELRSQKATPEAIRHVVARAQRDASRGFMVATPQSLAKHWGQLIHAYVTRPTAPPESPRRHERTEAHDQQPLDPTQALRLLKNQHRKCTQSSLKRLIGREIESLEAQLADAAREGAA